MISNETSKMFIRRKDMCRESTGRLRERGMLCAFGVFKSLTWGQFVWVSSGQSFCFVWLWVHLVWLRALSCMHPYLLAKLDSSASVSGKLTEYTIIWRPLPWGSFLQMPSLQESSECFLNLKNQKSVISLSFIRAGLNFSLPLLLSLSWSIRLQGTDSSCSTWSPSLSCLTCTADASKQGLFST